MWRRWGKPPNFFLFDIYWLFNLENNYLFKNLFEWANKKQNDFIIYNVYIFLKNKKHKEISLFYIYAPKKSRWYSLQFLKYRVWKTEIGILGHFLPFYSPKNPKNETFEKMKNKLLEISSFHSCVPKTTIPEIRCEIRQEFL